jgi:hypothetical protein
MEETALVAVIAETASYENRAKLFRRGDTFEAEYVQDAFGFRHRREAAEFAAALTDLLSVSSDSGPSEAATFRERLLLAIEEADQAGYHETAGSLHRLADQLAAYSISRSEALRVLTLALACVAGQAAGRPKDMALATRLADLKRQFEQLTARIPG